MPHIQFEYSANLEPDIDVQGLCETIRQQAASIEAFPMPGIRVRALRVDYYAIADGNPMHGFIDMSIRLREGRAVDVKQKATQAIFDCAKQYLADVMATRSIALSIEMRDIDASLSPKTGTIRDHLET